MFGRLPTIGAILVLLASTGLADEVFKPTKPTPEQAKFFENEVRPLLAKHCYECHGEDEQEGELRLDSLAAILNGGTVGPAVVPKKPDASLLIKAVTFQDPNMEMPPDRKMSAREIDVLRRWVQMGAPWPGVDKVTISRKAKATGITDEDREFWSFQPLKPSKSDDASIDAFIAKQLEARGLAFSPPAARRELIRRAYFDLTGLPPSPEAVDAFVNDDSPQAWEHLIDRLLASPQYGERWGRHWLDIVRFAQTNGYERDDEKPEAWRYRDYVIEAFNSDKPYNQFLMEQLAGDELDEVTAESIIATGYYRLGVWDDEPDDARQAEFDDLADVVATTGEALLGITINCGRCHEHKFDPISQEDYYRLLAFFRNIRRYEKPNKKPGSATFTDIGGEHFVQQWQESREAKIAQLQQQVAVRPHLKEAIDARISQLQSHSPPSGWALSITERGPKPVATNVLIRGNAGTPGDEVQPAFLPVLTTESPKLPEQAADGKSTGRRRVLAEWIAAADNPLTARVFVNRLWHYHFGRGIVASPSDFGHTGSRPSHPELLDWLAADFIAGGWKLKRMHKLIMMSRAYRQSSRATNVKAAEADPDNALVWRQNMRRLEAEAIRDSILAVSGKLNPAMGGRGIFPALSPEVLSTQSRPGAGWDKSSPEERSRRSVYIFVKRTLTVPMMDTFDQPTPDTPDPARKTTTIAPQALILLNSAFMNEQASAFAERLLNEAGNEPAAQIERAYRLAVSRKPTSRELAIAIGYLQQQQQRWQELAENAEADQAQRHALQALCKAILNLNEFVYVD